MICYYPISFYGQMETIPGFVEDAKVLYSTKDNYEVEKFNEHTSLNYPVCRFRLMEAKDFVSLIVNEKCIVED